MTIESKVLGKLITYFPWNERHGPKRNMESKDSQKKVEMIDRPIEKHRMIIA
jgi:hypothetical protein